MKCLKIFSVNIITILLFTSVSFATPSTTYWTPAVIDIQSFGVLHVGVDNYFTTFRKADDGAGAFPTDSGLTIGILPFEKVQLEVGVDLLEPTDYPIFFNAKIGSPEDVLFKFSPAIQLGMFNVGTHSKNTADAGSNNRTDYDIGYGLIGKTIPYLGRLHGGYYYGNKKTLLNGDGEKANTGYMVAFDHGFFPTKDGSGEYNKIVLAADYASGKNLIGGGGVGLYYYFTKDVSLLAGPVWFNDEKINGKWKITVQFDANVDLLAKK
jgi:hypothetical protein